MGYFAPMSWTWREYDPFTSVVADRGEITPESAMELFRNYDWKGPLTAMAARPKEVHYAPGFEITDPAKRIFYVGGAGDGQRLSFVLAYVRPKVRRKLTLLGYKEKFDPEYYSDIEIKTAAEVEVLLNAFLEGSTGVLDPRFG
jgi:hypothetical protein